MNLTKRAQCSINEAIDSLNTKPVKSTMLERLMLIREADRQVCDLPQPLQLGSALSYIAKNVSLPIDDNDILLGRISEVVPNKEEEEFLDLFKKEYGNRPAWHIDGGHITFSWEMLLQKGINGLLGDAQSELARRRGLCEPLQNLQFLEGMIWTYRAYQKYIVRYAQAAEAAKKYEQAYHCHSVAYEKPKTFYQALQLMLFVGGFYSQYCAIDANLSYGRLDDLLLSFYEADVASGILTEEIAGALIDDFNCKNNLILGRSNYRVLGNLTVETGWLRNPTYSTSQYVVLGGYSNRHPAEYNPLTKLFAEHINHELKNPKYVYRMTRESDSLTNDIIAKEAIQNACVTIYDDDVQIPLLIKAGFDQKDALEYTLHGDDMIDIAGKHANIMTLDTSLPEKIMSVLLDDNNKATKDYQTIDEVYLAIASSYKEDIKRICFDYRQKVASFDDVLPTRLTCADCFTQGCVDCAKGIEMGAVKYPTIYNFIHDVSNAACMMALLQEEVFDKNNCDFEKCANEIKSKLMQCERQKENAYANEQGKRLLEVIAKAIDEETISKNGEKDVFLLNVFS